MDDAPPSPPPPALTANNDTLRRFWQAEIGIRAGFFKSDGYDPYSTNDVLTQFSFGGTRTVFVDNQLSLAVGARWDYGGAKAKARGADTSLGMHRLAVPIDVRYHLTRWMYAFVRVAPGAIHTSTSITDPSSPETLSDAHWTFSVDGSVGSAFLLGPHSAPTRHLSRWWLTQELGYGWTTSTASNLGVEPNEDDLRQYGSITGRPLAMRGVFFRLGVAATF